MMGNKLIIMGLGLILLVGFFSPLVMGENDSLHVILMIEDRNYSVGDTIDIQLRVYEKGILTDVPVASDIFLGISTNTGQGNPLNISLTNQGTGIYHGTYTIKAADSNQNLFFFYTVDLGTDHEEGSVGIMVYSIQDTVDVSICGQDYVSAKPGDLITGTILTRTGTTLVPVTGFASLYVQAPNGQTQDLTYTTRQDGIYDVEFTAPEISVSGAYTIVAQPAGMNNQDVATIYVNVLDVWFHRLSESGNTVSFEICVADLLGAPVEGANILIQRNQFDSFTGITNASGRTLLHITNITGSVGFSGYAIAGGFNQTISGIVINPTAPQPTPNDFDILWEGSETVFEPGTDVVIPYAAYTASLPASSKTIYYYITATGTDFEMFFGTGTHIDTAREVISSGSVTTDSLGKFSLAFKTPEKQCAIQVQMEVPLDRANFPGHNFDHEDDMHYAVWPQGSSQGFVFYAYQGHVDGDKEVSVGGGGSFKPGKTGTVKISMSTGNGDPVAAFWGIGDGTLETFETWNPEWMSWVPYGNMLRLTETESGKYEASFLVPEFIEGQDVTVVSGYMDSADGTPHFDSKTISPGGGFNWLWVILIIVIIVVVVVLVIVIRDRF